ncbi:MAG: NAD-dependent epimerase/dehydratase family protein [Candidatus Helarchaeota archaeon]
MKILVSGANGFIGSNLVKKLVENGHNVISLVLKGTNEEFLSNLNTQIIYGDVTKPETLKNILNDIELIYHLAAIPSDWWNKSIFNVNYNGTKNILEEAIKNNVKRFVFMSSLVVHGFSNFNGADESTPIISPNKRRPYTKSKILCEKLLNEKKNEIEIVIIRPGFTIFGPNDLMTTYELCKTLESGSMPFLNHGKAKMCYSYVENLVEGLILAGTKKEAAGQTFIMCDNKPEFVTFHDFIDNLCKELNIKTPTLSLPYFLVFPLISLYENICRLFKKRNGIKLTTYRLRVAKFDLYFKADKAKKLLGYDPKIDFNNAIKKSITWYNHQKQKIK